MNEKQGQHVNAVDYVNGQLTPGQRRVMESHIAGCVHCQAAVAAVQQVNGEVIGENAKVLAGYVAGMLVSTVALFAPMANLLAQPPPPPVEEEKTAEIPFYEPLRVLQPRVAAGARGMRRFVGCFGLVLFLTIIVLLLPQPPGLTAAGHRALAAFVFPRSRASFTAHRRAHGSSGSGRPGRC